MTLDQINPSIDEALSLLPDVMDSTEARVMLFAIGLQESRFLFRRQMGNGPARGFWQFERGGGVTGVLTHKATRSIAAGLCRRSDIPATTLAAWQELENDDVLAAAFARLLLWSDPLKLPALIDAAGAWDLYLRTWRPGKPHRNTWDGCHAQARAFVSPPSSRQAVK